MTKLPESIEKKKLEQSQAYKREAFHANPNGYTVAPGLNEPDVDYEIGFEIGALEVKRIVESTFISAIQRRLASDDACGHPFDEDLSQALTEWENLWK